MVRKESKGHGTNHISKGRSSPASEVVIVEDVVTTGGSSLQAIERARGVRAEGRRVLAIIDRMEGGGAGIRRPRLSVRQPAEHRGFRHPAAKIATSGRQACPRTQKPRRS